MIFYNNLFSCLNKLIQIDFDKLDMGDLLRLQKGSHIWKDSEASKFDLRLKMRGYSENVKQRQEEVAESEKH